MNNNLHALIKNIQLKVLLNQETIEAIDHICQIKTYKKGDLIIRQDKTADYLYFIEKGAARTFYYHDVSRYHLCHLSLKKDNLHRSFHLS